MKVVITTVGTSLLENYRKNEERFSRMEKFEYSISTKGLSAYQDFKEDLEEDGLIEIEKIKKYALENFPNASAELTSLQKLKEKYPNEDFIIYLLTSDTFEGYLVGEILKEALESEDIKRNLNINKIELKYIEDLRIDSTETFKNGLNNLIDTIYEIIVKDEKNQTVYGTDEVIFNITGGYKGVIPYISTIAQIFGYEIVYTFESIEKENDLISVEPLPIELEKSLLDLYYPFLKNLDKLSDEEKEFLIEKGLLDESNKLTPLGKILLLTSEKTVFKEDAFGQFVEYLVYEYFVKRILSKDFEVKDCLQHFTFENVEIGKSLGKGKTDIDIYLENSKEFAWVEIKPITYLLNDKSFSHLIEQIKNKQLPEINSLNKEIYKYLLTLYSFSIDKHCDNKFKQIDKSKVSELKKIFNEKRINFTICYFCLPLVKKDKKEGKITSKTYQKLFSDFKLKNLQNLKNILEG